MNPGHLLRYVIAEALKRIGMDSPQARALMLGTAMVESNLTELQQHGGPAIGLWQVEPATHDDIWLNYLAYRPDISRTFSELAVGDPTPDQMRWNLLYACAMARLIYWRSPRALPALQPFDMAKMWKSVYNTELGAGDVHKAVPLFAKAIRHMEGPKMAHQPGP